MANTDNPHGLRCIGTMHGGAILVETFNKLAAYATAIFIGDACHRVASADIEPGASATPGTTLWSGVALNYGAPLTLTEHQLIVDPFAIFEAQDNNDTDGLAYADEGLNINIEANTGNASLGISGHELDESTILTTNTLDLHIRKLLAVPGNAYGAWSRMEVSFNKHRYATGVAGV